MSGQHGQGDQGTKNTLRTLIILSNNLSQTHMECTFWEFSKSITKSIHT